MRTIWPAEPPLRVNPPSAPRRPPISARGLLGLVVPLIVAVIGLVIVALLGVISALAPQLAFALAALLALLAVGGGLLYWIAPGGPLWVRACLLVVLAHLLLSYGFGNATVGIGSVRAPVSELVLVVALIGSLAYLWRVGYRQLPFPLWLFVLWQLVLLVVHLPRGFEAYGMPALRDALPTVQILFVIPGYCIAIKVLQDPDKQRWIARFLLALGLTTAVYGLAYPLQSALLVISPRMTGMQQAVPLFGYYSTWPTVAVTGMFGVLLWRWAAPTTAHPQRDAALAFLMLIGFVVGFFLIQSRAGYVMVLAVTMLIAMAGGQSRTTWRIIGVLAIAAVVLLAMSMLGLEVEGRIGKKISLESIIEQTMTLSGEAERGSDMEGAAAGIQQRRHWREMSLHMWARNGTTMAVGVGYGPALTDFQVAGTGGAAVVVREPHNSYVSALARSGFIGFTILMLFHATVFFGALRLYKRLRAADDKPRAAVILGAAIFFICNYLNALGQPNFESPHFVVPYFFAAGIVIALMHTSAKGTGSISRASLRTTS